jgi:hypothetical protein
MNKKAELEYKQLIKLGVDEPLARLIVMKKYHADSEETAFLLQEEQDEQNDLKEAIRQFSFQPFEKISSNIVYDKNKNETV